MKGTGSADAELMLSGLMAARLKTEFTYDKMVSNSEEFVAIWGAESVVCNEVDNTLKLSF